MSEPSGHLNGLAAEIYPIIASHLPLHSTPSTLLALALTSHHISSIVLPVLHSRLLLKNEKDAIEILQKIGGHPTFGREVRELHIMSDLSVETMKQQPPMDVLRRVQDVTLKGCLPFIHTLDLRLMNRWYFDPDKDYLATKGFGQLDKEFWRQLRDKCPRLKCLTLKGFANSLNDPWIDNSGCLEFLGLTSFTLHFLGLTLSSPGCDKLFNHISRLSSSLHTLDLEPSAEVYLPLSSLFQHHFPHLRSLSLSSFSDVDTEESMLFFQKHSSIEFLDISANISVSFRNSRWFTRDSELPRDFLPHLRYLRARWIDVRSLAPLLHQLTSLSIHASINAQIPYLLRKVLPDGLPQLRSLGIGQMPSRNNGDDNPTAREAAEGSRWYESESNGTFHETPAYEEPESRTVFDEYMHSIVRAVPNLEELSFSCKFRLSECMTIAGHLAKLPNLKRLYYKSYYDSTERLTPAQRDMFSNEAFELVQVVPGLDSITNTATACLPYVTARTRRDDSRRIVGVEVGNGFGMLVGYADEAFSSAPDHDV